MTPARRRLLRMWVHLNRRAFVLFYGLAFIAYYLAVLSEYRGEP